MKIYGYALNSADLVEMQEISLRIDSQELRKISDFLLKTAKLMDENGEKFGHEHFIDFNGLDNSSFPDIIISR